MKSIGIIQDVTGLWYSPNTDATNFSGFTGLPGGKRYDDGTFYPIGIIGFWWSYTEESMPLASSWARTLYYNNSLVLKPSYNKTYFLSVRLVKD